MIHDNTIIRRINKKDFIRIKEIDAEIFPKDVYLSIEIIEEISIDLNKEFYILVAEDSIVGFIILNFMDDTLHLYRIGIASAYQGRGYGTKLMEFAISRSKEKNIFKKSVLYVLRDNDAAINLYRKFQYKIAKKSWQFIIRYNEIELSSYNEKEYTSKLILSSKTDFERVNRLYGVPVERLNNMISPRNKFIEFYHTSNPIGFCRFDPTFPGAFPFIIKVENIYGAISELIKYAKPEFDYIRLTFDENEELADFLFNEKFTCVHEMFVMKRKL